MRRSTLALLAAGAACAATALLYHRIRTYEGKTMTEIDDAVSRVTDAQARNDAAQAAALQRVNDDVTDLRSTVDQLRAQINSNDGGARQTVASLDLVVTRLEESTARLQGVDPVPDEPAPGDDTETPTPGDDTTGGDVETPTPGDDTVTPAEPGVIGGTDGEVIDNPNPGDPSQRDA